MSTPAWSPDRLPDAADSIVVIVAAAGATISPSGIASLEAFGAAAVTTQTTLLPGYLEFFGWENAAFYAGISRLEFVAGIA